MSSTPVLTPLSAPAIMAGDTGQLTTLLEQEAAFYAAAEQSPISALVTQFFSLWQRASGLPDAVLAALQPLQAQLLVSAATEGSWITSPAHPAWLLFAELQRQGIGYQPGLGRAGEKLLIDLRNVCEAVGREGWQASVSSCVQQGEQERTRIGRLEQRLLDSERGQLRARRAQELAAKTLNRQMSGRLLPAPIAHFLQTEWYRDLQWVLLQFGERSEQWRRWLIAAQRLIASLQPVKDDPQEHQALYSMIPDIAVQLRELLQPRAHDEALLESQLALVEQQHLLLLRGQSLQYANFEPLAADDPWLSSSTTISRELLAKVDAVADGDWFVYQAPDAEQRLKLLLKFDDTAQLLFVNRLGVKALQQSFEEFAYLLSTGTAVLLPAATGATRQLGQVLEQHIAQCQERQREHSQALSAARTRTDEQARRRVEARAKAISEAKTLAEAEAKSKLEAEVAAAAAALQQSRDAEQARRQDSLAQQSLAADQRQRAARQSAALLPIGGWIELFNDVGESQRLKLAVKLPSSAKMIFVDREGARRAELVQDTFAARLQDGSARILDQGPQFEDTLAKVVDSMRRDRAGRGQP